MPILESRIESVKVYHSGATVYRRAELPAGQEALPGEVELQGLPLALVDATVRVRIEAVEPAGADLIASDVRVGLHALTAQAAEDADGEELKLLQRKLLRAELLLRQLDLESSYLGGMQVPSRPGGEEGKPPPASPTAARVLLEQFVDESLRARLQEARVLRQQARELREQAAALQDRINRSSSARRARPEELRKTVVARLLQTGPLPATSARVLVEYFVPGVCWAPAYQCRLSRDCMQAEIQMRALVAQRSGEDWRGVQLTLSTASALSFSELPELSSVRIGRLQPPPPPRRGFRPPPRGAEALFADLDREQQLVKSLVPAAPRWRVPLLSVAAPQLLEHAVPEAAASFSDLSTPAQQAYGAPAMSLMAEMAPEPAGDDVYYEEEATENRVEAPRLSRLVPAIPPAPPPPPPMAAPAPRSSLRSAAPAKAKRAVAASRRRGEVDASLPEAPLLDAPAPALAALLFSQLRLHGTDQPDSRGQLLPIDQRTAYLELLGRQSLQIDFDPLEIAYQAQQAAAAVGSLPLPEGAHDVRHAAGRFDFCYQAEAPVDLESDGTFHSLPLGSLQAPSQVCYIVVPREEAAAYRTATLRNPLPSPLLPGPVEVHVGGDYVLSSTLPVVARGGEFQLGLGVEQAIKVARNTEFSEARSGTKVVAMSELRHQIKIDLHNHLDREILCEVRERIPQPGEEAEVVVEELEVEPPWAAYDQSERRQQIQGGRRWQVTIGPGQPCSLRALYVVKIYANNELSGGNRREV